MLRSFNMNLDSFLLNKKQVSEQVEQIEVSVWGLQVRTFGWTLTCELLVRKKTPKTHKIWARFGPKPLAGLIWQQEEKSLLSPMTMTSHKLYCFRPSMIWRNKKNVRIILPVIHETSDLAKKMYIQDGNLYVVQSISHIPDYEPSRRKT
jgi:hypothetical protein